MITVLGFALAGAMVAQAAAGGGSIAGCVVDRGGSPLPGATLTLKGADVTHALTSDQRGCYEFKELPRGTYRLTGTLPGFNIVTRRNLSVGSSDSVRVDLTMPVSWICECLRFVRTLSTHRMEADAVLYVRLSDAAPEPAWTDAQARGLYLHTATVLNILKAPRNGLSPQVSILQSQRSGAPAPYDAGQEAVVFLKGTGGGEPFQLDFELTGTSEPPPMVFLVREGRVQQAPPGFHDYVGKPLEALLKELR